MIYGARPIADYLDIQEYVDNPAAFMQKLVDNQNNSGQLELLTEFVTAYPDDINAGHLHQIQGMINRLITEREPDTSRDRRQLYL